jgi:hypothetical protein
LIDEYKKGNASINKVKNTLWRLSNKYNQVYLVNSYYFIL